MVARLRSARRGAAREQLTQAQLAVRFRVSNGTVSNWLRRVEETGSVAPKPHGGVVTRNGHLERGVTLKDLLEFFALKVDLER